MINCIIVDDEEMSRATIEHFVSQTEMLNLIGLCSSAVEAANFLKDQQIDLIFLDIEMPQMSGLELIKTLDHSPQIILVTSKKEYAVEAFEYNVVDYLVKPVDYSRFLQAVNRVKETSEIVQGRGNKDEIFIKSDSKIVKLNFSSILYVEALADYAIIQLGKARHIIHSTMKGLEQKLPGDTFVRVHRSYIVNISKIDSIEDMNIVIGSANIPVGASYRDKFMKKINML